MNINELGITTIISVLTFLLGLIFGHRFALFRDRRKEYNEIADIVYSSLLEEKKHAEREMITKGPTEEDFQHLLRRSYFIRRMMIKKSLDTYRTAHMNVIIDRSSSGQPIYRNVNDVVIAINKLIRSVGRE
ncbi:MAG: hypothetical protein AB2761_18855 [Candidatus Thiodiazotropha endolucinida]